MTCASAMPMKANPTTTYYKWSNKKNTYILIPEMTITMDNPDM